MQKVFRALVVSVPRRLAKSGSPLPPKEPSNSVAQLDEDRIDCCFHDYQFLPYVLFRTRKIVPRLPYLEPPSKWDARMTLPGVCGGNETGGPFAKLTALSCISSSVQKVMTA